ncbi:hypothetical protein D3C81_945310 [compost metagenome]
MQVAARRQRHAGRRAGQQAGLLEGVEGVVEQRLLAAVVRRHRLRGLRGGGQRLGLLERLLEQTPGRVHAELRASRGGLVIGRQEQALAAPDGAPSGRAQLEALATLLPLVVDQIAEVQLRLARKVGGELDALLPLPVLEAQLVVALGADHVARQPAVPVRDQVFVLAVVLHVGDVRLVRIAVAEGHVHVSAIDEREVEAGLPRPRERLGQRQRHAFAAIRPGVEIEVEADRVVPLLRQVGVLVLARRGHAGRQRALDPRPSVFGQRQPEAPVRRDGLEGVAIGGIARAGVDDLGDDLPVRCLGQRQVHAQDARRAQVQHVALAREHQLAGHCRFMAQLRLPLAAREVQVMGAEDIGLPVGCGLLARDIRLTREALPRTARVVVRHAK